MRYFTRPKACWVESDYRIEDGKPLVPHIEASDHKDVDTGLVDKRGDPIMRAPNPMGFGGDL